MKITTIKAMRAALGVMTTDPKIYQWLEKNDPKALEQACEAIDEYDRESIYSNKRLQEDYT